MKFKKWIRPALFTLGGALAGLAYDHFKIRRYKAYYAACSERIISWEQKNG